MGWERGGQDGGREEGRREEIGEVAACVAEVVYSVPIFIYSDPALSILLLLSQNAVVCLRLKPVQSHHGFTIIYFHWNDQRKRLMACVAELKSHLIRQLQVSLTSSSALGSVCPSFGGGGGV